MLDPHIEYYGLLRTCLQGPPDKDLLNAIAERAADPPVNSRYIGLKEGWQLLTDFFQRYTIEEAKQHTKATQDYLFGNPLRPKLDPYASQYLYGRRHSEALVNFRRFLKKWQLVPGENKFQDFEDHAIFILDTVVQISYLMEHDGEHWEEALEECLQEHIIPWFPKFLKDVEKEDLEHGEGGFYAGLAKIGQAIIVSEAEVLH